MNENIEKAIERLERAKKYGDEAAQFVVGHPTLSNRVKHDLVNKLVTQYNEVILALRELRELES